MPQEHWARMAEAFDLDLDFNVVEPVKRAVTETLVEAAPLIAAAAAGLFLYLICRK